MARCLKIVKVRLWIEEEGMAYNFRLDCNEDAKTTKKSFESACCHVSQ